MRYVDVKALTGERVLFREPEVFAEAWVKRRAFSLYKHTPRPLSAFFFIATDVTATFYPLPGDSVTARRGDVLYIPEGTAYHARIGGTSGGHVDTYTVNFALSDDAGESLKLSDKITVLAHVDDDRFELRAAALQRALREIDGKKNHLKTNAEFYALLDAVATAATEQSDKYYPIRVGAEALRNEWNKNEHVDRYAALCGVSSTYFYRCFRAWSGKSPVEYRNLLRLSNAETMLRYTDMRVGEIAEACGFDDAFYFCRLFAARYGASPQKYRKAFRSEQL